ncbi:hypothetical protein L2E82_32762 [Cichorium intybus]|uniref:Uncharacterized protein n=1 Tax=Cichorium intybus TaxID=13427 RepID=A0ACB9BHC0_CICIN|nr:hypothetical protein L2E82_32762 [Cichorium intybus]
MVDNDSTERCNRKTNEDCLVQKGSADELSVVSIRSKKDGTGKVNHESVAYYNRLIDYLLLKGVGFAPGYKES